MLSRVNRSRKSGISGAYGLMEIGCSINGCGTVAVCAVGIASGPRGRWKNHTPICSPGYSARRTENSLAVESVIRYDTQYQETGARLEPMRSEVKAVMS
jgi:hypothetical protein